jgi:hypothetical protein
MSHEFLEQTSIILNIASSLDYTICCETLMILIILCESYEDASPLLCQAWYDPIRLDKCQIWPAIAQLITTSFKSESTRKIFIRKTNFFFFFQTQIWKFIMKH